MAGDRSLTYKVSIDTSSARAQAADVRRAIEAELKTIKTGQIKAPKAQKSPLSNGADGTGDLASNEFSKIEKAISGKITGELRSMALGFIGVQAAIRGIGELTELAKLGTEVSRANKSFEILIGGAGKAESAIYAIQKASNGTVDSLSAVKIGVQATSLGLANTTEEFERLTKAARLIVQVSPTINNIGEALTQLALFSSNEQSYQRADQLGLAATEVRERIKELRAENDNLTGSEAKLEASLQIVNEKFGATADTVEAQATSIEKLSVAWAELRIALSQNTGPIQDIAGFFAGSLNELDVWFSGVKAKATVVEEALGSVTDAYQNQANILQNTPLFGDALKKDRLQVVGQLQEIQQIFQLSNAAIGEDPSLVGYQQQIQEIVVSVTRWGYATEEQIDTLRRLYDEMQRQKEINAPQVAAQTAEEAAAAAEAARVKTVFDQYDPIQQDLFKQAKDSIGDLGIDAAVALYKQERDKVDAALQELADSGVTDAEEIALRAVDIMGTFSNAFTNASEEAQNFAFDGLDQSFANIFDQLNFPEIDFIPYLEDIRDQAVDLYQEIADTGYLTEENAAQLDYLSSAAAASADEQSNLTAVVNQLGEGFLEQNVYVGELIGKLYETEAAYRGGQISAEQFAGATAALGGQLLSYISQVGGATSATYALIAAQSGMQGTPGFITGFGRGNATGAYLKSQEDARAREQARKDAERARKEAENAAKKAAREAESAAKRAGKALEDGAKKARQELESALKNVPGLFSRSQVTQGQLDQAKSGVPQNFADDYIRRLEDEVFNGNDWQDVSIDEARSSLQALGVQVSNDNKVAFQQFVEAWESGLLFFDADNIAKFINAEAVQASIDLQEKARIGQENIMKAFGVAIDDAADAAVSGISAASGGASGSFTDGEYTVPVTAELIPIPDSEFEPGGAFAPIVKPVVQPQVQGPLPKSAFMPTLGGVSPVIDVAAIQGEIAAATFDPIMLTATLGEGVGQEIAYAIGNQLGEQATVLQGHGQAIGGIIKYGIGEAFQAQVTGDTVNTDLVRNLIDRIALEAQSETKRLRGIGSGIAGLVVEGTSGGLGVGQDAEGNQRTDIALGYFSALDSQFNAAGNFFYLIGQSAAASINSGLTAGLSTATITPSLPETASADFVAAVAGMLLQSTDILKQQGNQVGGVLVDGINEAFTVQVDDQQQVKTGLIDTLIFRTAAEIGARKSDLTGLGVTTASNILSGATEQFNPVGGGNSIVQTMIEGIGTGIRANVELLRQRGGTVAREMIGGFSAQFNSEEFKTTLIAAGETMASYLTIGILSGINGGQLVEAIGAQVLADITATVEEPAP